MITHEMKDAHIKQLMEENERLRAALEKIKVRSSEELETVCCYDEGGLSSINGIAQKALEKAKVNENAS